MQNVTAEQVKEAAIAAGVGRIDSVACSVCEIMLSYIVLGEDLLFDKNCSCVDPSPPYPVEWKEAAARINQEGDEETKFTLMQSFGFTFEQIGPPQEDSQVSGKIPFEWEDVDDTSQRTKTFGGWIVKTNDYVLIQNPDHHAYMQPSSESRISTCFVPDPKWEWEL